MTDKHKIKVELEMLPEDIAVILWSLGQAIEMMRAKSSNYFEDGEYIVPLDALKCLASIFYDKLRGDTEGKGVSEKVRPLRKYVSWRGINL